MLILNFVFNCAFAVQIYLVSIIKKTISKYLALFAHKILKTILQWIGHQRSKKCNGKKTE